MDAHRLALLRRCCGFLLLVLTSSNGVALDFKQQNNYHQPGTYEAPQVWIDTHGWILATHTSSTNHWHTYTFNVPCPDLAGSQTLLFVIEDSLGGGVYMHDSADPCGGAISLNRRTGVVTQASGTASNLVGDQDGDLDTPECDIWHADYDCTQCDFNGDGVIDCCDPPWGGNADVYLCDSDCDGIVDACQGSSYDAGVCDCDNDGIKDACDPDSANYNEQLCNASQSWPSVNPDGYPTQVPGGMPPYLEPNSLGASCPDGTFSDPGIWPDCPQSNSGDESDGDGDGSGGGGGGDGGGGGGDGDGGGSDGDGDGGDGGSPGGGDWDFPGPGDPYDPGDITDPPDDPGIDECCEKLLAKLESIRQASWGTYGATSETAFQTTEFRRDFGTFYDWFKPNTEEFQSWFQTEWDTKWTSLLDAFSTEGAPIAPATPDEPSFTDESLTDPLRVDDYATIASENLPSYSLGLPAIADPGANFEGTPPVWNFTIPSVSLASIQGGSYTAEAIDLQLNWAFWFESHSYLGGASFYSVFYAVSLLFVTLWGAQTIWEELRKY